MRKILVALDGTPGSEKALEAAVQMAQSDGGCVAAIAVLDRLGDPNLDRLAESSRGQARRRLEEVLQAAASYARSRGVLLTPLLREGHPGEAIVACAEQEGAQLLVLGNHGGTGPRPSLGGLGGTADQVSGHCPCTVMIVK